MKLSEMNYRTQRLCCRFCENFDVITGKAFYMYEFICTLTKKETEDNGICDHYKQAKEGE